jgi:hypothetical protein
MRYFMMCTEVKALAIFVALCFLAAPTALGQTQICDEDFESVTPGDIPRYNPTGTGEISECARTLYGHHEPQCDGAFLASGGNPGQCARAYLQSTYINGDSYTEPKWRFDNTIGGGTQIYLKFDLLYGADLGTTNANREIYNMKIIRITSHINASAASDAHWHPQINFEPGDDSYSLYSWSQGDGYGEYHFHRATTKRVNQMMDNQWHTFEIFMDLGSVVVADKYDNSADGIVRIWEDGVMLLEDNAVPFRTLSDEGREINSMAFIRHAKAGGAPVLPMAGHLYYDNIEVWDGMPGGGGGDTTPPNTTISSGPSGTIDYADVTFTCSGSDNEDPPGALVYQHRLDAGTWSSWTSSTSAVFNGLTDGEHTYDVRARDTSGNIDPSPALRTFTVDTGGGDTTPPDPPENVDAEAVVD